MSETNNVVGEQLVSFIERAERLHEEKKGIESDLRELYAEAKGNGFDTKAMKKVLARRRKDYAELQEEEAIEELYLDAIERAERDRSSRARTQARDAREAETPKHDPETGEIHENPQSPSNRDVSAGDEASSGAAPQGEAPHAGTGSETLAGHEGRSARRAGETLPSDNSPEGAPKTKRQVRPGRSSQETAAEGPQGVTAGETAPLSVSSPTSRLPSSRGGGTFGKGAASGSSRQSEIARRYVDASGTSDDKRGVSP